MRKEKCDRNGRRNTGPDNLLLGWIVLVGLAEAAHLAAIILNWSFTRCAAVLWGTAGAGIFCSLCFFLFKRFRSGGIPGKGERGSRISGCARMGRTERILAAVFGILVVSQIIFICGWSTAYRQGDMMAETVGSFLSSDGIYRVNPMTGLPYREGIPSRLKILCLPTLYGSLCKITGCSPRTLVWQIVPVVTLLASYTAFASLGRCLFPWNPAASANGGTEDSLYGSTVSGDSSFGNPVSEGAAFGAVKGCWDRKKAGCFMIGVSILLWAGTYAYGVDGFNLLFCGYQGVAIRNAVLVPWLFSLCFREKWLCAFLCVLAEACMVWTFYGMGVCFFITAAMAVFRLAHRLAAGKLQGASA